MNFLETLALRALEQASVVEPPRIPFVNVFPEGDSGASAEPASLPSRPATPTSRASEPARRAAPFEPNPSVNSRRHIADATSPAIVAPVNRRAVEPAPPAPPEPPPTTIERILERTRTEIVRDAGEANPAATPKSSPTPVVIETRSRTELKEVHRHLLIERHFETPEAPVIAPDVKPIPAASPPPRTRVATRSVSPPPAPPGERHQAAPAPREIETAPSPPEAGASVHVSIGRIVVRVQRPSEPTRTTHTRPLAPALDLATYTAARRGRDER